MEPTARATDVSPLRRPPARLAPLGAPLPLLADPVPAASPPPLGGGVERVASLDEVIGADPATTFFVGVGGDAMADAGVHDGDVLVVDRARPPRDGDVVVAALDGDLVVRRLRLRNDTAFLLPENPDYPPLAVDEHSDLAVWGVATHVLHEIR